MKIAFLDRDGTIIHDYPDADWRHVKEPEFYPDSIEFLRELQKCGYQFIFVSNQYLIADGIITEEQFHEVNNKFLQTLTDNNIDALKFLYCPHNEGNNCNCKKPNTGMIDVALAEFPEIKLNKSFYVGDSLVDVKLAEKFQLQMFHLTDTPLDEVTNYQQVLTRMDVLRYL